FENGQIVLGDKTILEKENKELKKQGLPLTQDQIKSLRKEWEVITNHHLAMAGIEERIDCRSYREQGVHKLPTVKLGARASENERNGIATRKGDYNRLVEKANRENWQGTMEEYIEKTIYDLEQEIIVESRLQTSPTPPQPQGQLPKPSIGKPTKPKLSLEERMARWEQKQEKERQIDQRGEQALSKFEQRMQQHEQRLAEKAERERLERLEQQRQAELAKQARLEQQRQAEQARLAEIAREQQEYENRNSRGFSP
ncbi:MobA/MobL family protein, partial [Moraxella sp. TY5]